MSFKISKLDHQGRGITHDDGKVIFVENALPSEEVEIDVTGETSKYKLATVKEYIQKSERRVKSKCPKYEECGGCHLRHMSYDDTLVFKKEKLEEILIKYAKVENAEIEVIKNKNRDFYRNKVEVHIENGVSGFYKKNSHDLVEIDRCLNAEEAINIVLRSIDILHIENGVVTVKSNYNGEIILVIDSKDEPNIEIERLRDKVKLVGIVYDGKLLFGSDHFIEIIDGLLFKESYDSFFQVNRYINGELFKLLDRYLKDDSVVLDMCSGVGTLSIVASKKAKKVYGIEIVENAVRDAIVNAKMNKVENVEFMLGDAFKNAQKISDDIDTIIIDPPRSGLSKEGIESILNINPRDVIYISCDPVTLSRDIDLLSTKYTIKKIYLLDMFSFTYHVECVCLLSHKFLSDLIN